jgi:Dolichyl-phosphate-mannose-protein mannosyltransferase
LTLRQPPYKIQGVSTSSIEAPPIAEQRAVRARAYPAWVYYAVLVLVLAATALIRLHLRNFPLERDEGEYAYAGQLILQGVAPYKIADNMKLPGTYAAYAALMAIFGQTPAGIHQGLLLVNALTIWMVFLAAARLFGRLAGLAAAISYALLAISPSVLGFAAHASHFVIFFAMAGLLALMRALKTKNPWALFTCGLLFGMAFLMTQAGIAFALFAGLYLLIDALRDRGPGRSFEWIGTARRLAFFSAGVFIPFGVTCLLLWRAGGFGEFWFWTVTYARQYISIVKPSVGLIYFRMALRGVTVASRPLWLLAGVGLTASLWNKTIRAHALLATLFLACSFLAICPGFYFRQHYFVMLLPALALLIGAAVGSATEKIPSGWVRAVPIVIFALICTVVLLRQRTFLFEMDPQAACRHIYGINPFPEAIPVADYIRSHSSPTDTVAVVGSEPEIYFYAHRHSATGYIYTYSLMEPQPYASHMQRQMADQIAAASPAFIVFVGVPSSWLVRPDSDRFILDWTKQYLHEHYELVGIADILPQTQYRWGADARIYQRRSQYGLEIYRRTG